VKMGVFDQETLIRVFMMVKAVKRPIQWHFHKAFNLSICWDTSVTFPMKTFLPLQIKCNVLLWKEL
jgi:hypothetical protein